MNLTYLDNILGILPESLLHYVRQIPPLWWWYTVNAVVLSLLAAALWFAYYCFRRAFGHEKFKGRWYGTEDMQKLKQELYSGVREGRLPDTETMAFLDKHVYGKESKLRRMSGTGWL
jgi:hypothetical protein